jgi:very-short-patch-repair endonuclease
MVQPAHFLHTGTRCPECSLKVSKGEDKIIHYLNEKNINFIYDKKHINLKNHRFDFQIPEYNIIIEYDGRQHYEEVNKFGGQDQLILQQEKDKEKNEFCKTNGINLIRIPY